MITRPEAVPATRQQQAAPEYEEMALTDPSQSDVQIVEEDAVQAADPEEEGPIEPIQTPALADVYAHAGVRAPGHGFTILKIAEMLSSAHIQSLPLEAKRASVLMALEASSVGLGDVLEDAARRDRALNEFEARQQKNFQDLRTRKQEQNQQIQAQIENLIEQCRAHIQENDKEVSSEKARLDEWRTKKREEERRIRSAAAHFGASTTAAAAEPHPASLDPAVPAQPQRGAVAQPELVQMPAARRQVEANAQESAASNTSTVPAANGAAAKKPSLWRR